MRTLPFLCILIGLVLLIATPASANTRQDYIEDKLDYWIDYAENIGSEIIETEIDTISSERRLRFDLGPGEYTAYAEGGERIEDLDMVVRDDRGRELDSDYLTDNFPIVSFSLRDWEEVEFELTVYDYSGHSNQGYFCFVLARERGYNDGWRDRDRQWDDDYRDDDWDRDNRRRDRDRWDDDDWWEDDDYWDDDWDRDDRGRDRDRWNDDDWRDDDDWWDDDYWDDDWDRDDRGRDRDRWNDDDRWDDDNYWYDDDYYWDDRDEWDDEWDDWWYDWDWDRGRGWGRDDDWSRSDRRNTVEDRLDHLYDFAHRRGLYPFVEDIGEITDTRHYNMTLQRGYYVVFAAGGPWIDDLDLRVDWRGGWEIAEDIDTDATPAVWFYLPERTTVEIEVDVYSFGDGHYEDYYCMLLCED